MSKHEADVIVLGTGPGGMGAVNSAVAAGAEVIVVERRNQVGGNARWSTGYLVFVDTPMQRKAGIQDSVELFLEDARKAVGKFASEFPVIYDERLARIFAEESSETYDLLIERGVDFDRFIQRPLQHQATRIHAVASSPMLAEAFAPDFANERVTHNLLGTQAVRLLTDAGRVVGVRIRSESEDEEREIYARRGVVLATGGYQANPAIRARYQPGARAHDPYLGVDAARGTGHLLGQAVGGDLINMGVIPPLVMVASSMLEESIAVNREGKRFHNEPGPYEMRVEAVRREPGEWAYYILDERGARAKAMYLDQMPEPPIVAETLDALADKLGVPTANLQRTVARWNAFLASGKSADPDFGRVSFSPEHTPIAVGPYTAAKMIVGTDFCAGGFNVTTSMQVVDVFGDAIPGLFAAGDCVGGLNPCADLGGIHINGGLTLGRRAGAAASGSLPLVPPHLESPFDHSMPSKIGEGIELVHVGPS